jgi:hypothetical protein
LGALRFGPLATAGAIMTDILKGGNRANRAGRPKGSVNKTTAAAKNVIAAAAEELGGQARLVAWVREDAQNERAFWAQIYPKLLPLQVSGENGGPLKVEFVTVYEDKP